MKKDRNKYPKGWNRATVDSIIGAAEKQTDDEAIAEADAAWQNRSVVMMPIPTELASQVSDLISRHKSPKSTRVKRRPHAA